MSCMGGSGYDDPHQKMEPRNPDEESSPPEERCRAHECHIFRTPHLKQLITNLPRVQKLCPTCGELRTI